DSRRIGEKRKKVVHNMMLQNRILCYANFPEFKTIQLSACEVVIV
ncbi:unnamed protein product, partial [Allacma fusca]